MNDHAFGMAPVEAECAAAARLAARLQDVASGCALCIGSVRFLARTAVDARWPVLYVWRLAGRAFVLLVRAADPDMLAATMHHAAWRDACDSAWPVTSLRAPELVQRFTLDAPLHVELICAMTRRALAQEDRPATALWCIELDSGTVHAPAPRPTDAAQVGDHTPLRRMALGIVGPAALALATHPGSGLMGSPASDLDAPVPSCSATLRLAGVPDIITLGRAGTARQAAQVACLEAIERHAGLTAAHYARVWHAPFADIAGPKLDPRACGLHLPASYAAPDFPFVPFSEDLVLDWVHGRELGSDRAVALPASLAYYGGSADIPRVRLAFETSNGCAVGTSFEEASLHGLLELIERDAFLMAWYRRTPLPDITRQLARHPGIGMTLRRLALLTGGTVRILDSTREAGIPSVICCLLGKDNATDGSLPAQVLSAGASLNHAYAASAALGELSGHWLFLRQRFDDPAMRRHARALHEGTAEAVSMEDHGYANALPESRERIAFLLQSGEAPDHPYHSPQSALPTGSVRASLAWVLERLAGAGMRPVAVPQQTPLLRQAGLHCVKVVCPGLLPMTFGHLNRRLAVARLDGQARELAASLPPHPFM